jgi:Cys-tRNA(Pro)/Cys-tRNA(Cys) deacylase
MYQEAKLQNFLCFAMLLMQVFCVILRYRLQTQYRSTYQSTMTKTNACRILDKHHITYELREYAWSEEELDAVSVARKIGLPPEQVFKTLVLMGDALKYFVAVIPANAELDLKRTAKLTGNKSCAMLPVKELLPLTGYIRGGCSPVGMKKLFPTFIDVSAQTFDIISMSPGQRGQQVLLSPNDLASVINAQFVDFCEGQILGENVLGEQTA